MPIFIPRHRSRRLRTSALRWLLALWTLLALPAIAQPLHDHAHAPQNTAAAEHCAGHAQPAPAPPGDHGAEQHCLCLQACTGATALLSNTSAVPPSPVRTAPQFTTLALTLPPSPLSLPFRPPIARLHA